VTVDDIDALVNVVPANGGVVQFGPEDVFDSGRMMGIQDPAGAQFYLIQKAELDPWIE
jgi:predicted enzyme related to lactoylglutathione lyase